MITLINPTFRVEPSHVTVAQGDMVQLQCVMTSDMNKSVNYQWEKVREDINEQTTQVIGSLLKMSQVMVSDRGLYVCTVITNCGTMARSRPKQYVKSKEII